MSPAIHTERLELVAATADLVRLELVGVGRLAAALGCEEPESWPAPLNDSASQQWTLDLLQRDPSPVGWAIWYVVRDESAAPRDLIGVAGFKGPPVGGACEIGYSIVPGQQRRGYGTEAARALVAWAFASPDVARVRAETLPGLTASIRVMEGCGMTFEGAGTPEEGQATVRYAVTRQAFESAPGRRPYRGGG
jgi:ribosomal-protein-alanine N-acetyltransferase